MFNVQCSSPHHSPEGKKFALSVQDVPISGERSPHPFPDERLNHVGSAEHQVLGGEESHTTTCSSYGATDVSHILQLHSLSSLLQLLMSPARISSGSPTPDVSRRGSPSTSLPLSSPAPTPGSRGGGRRPTGRRRGTMETQGCTTMPSPSY